MRGKRNQMRQATTAKVHLDAVGAARFSGSARSTGGFERLYRAGALLPIAHVVQKSDSGPEPVRNLANVGSITQGTAVADRQAAPGNAAQIEFWNSAATRAWADQYARMDRAVAALTNELLALSAPRPGERVLDIGCGAGTTVLELATRVGPGGRVLGADVSEPSIARARERIAAAGLRHAEVIVADASVHPFPPDSFDLTFSRFGIMFFSDP